LDDSSFLLSVDPPNAGVAAVEDDVAPNENDADGAVTGAGVVSEPLPNENAGAPPKPELLLVDVGAAPKLVGAVPFVFESTGGAGVLPNANTLGFEPPSSFADGAGVPPKEKGLLGFVSVSSFVSAGGAGVEPKENPTLVPFVVASSLDFFSSCAFSSAACPKEKPPD
jgi:hypothetical protein